MKQVKPQTSEQYFATRKPRRWWLCVDMDCRGTVYRKNIFGTRKEAENLSAKIPDMQIICVEEVPDASSE